VNREAQGFLLLLLGGAVLRASLTDVYLRYVKAGLRPLLLIAGVVLILAAVATFWYERKRARTRRGELEDDHGHREPRVAWLLVLPLFALILVVPPPLGAYTADRTGTALQPTLTAAKTPAGDPARTSLLNYAALAVYERGGALGGRRVEITGFITVGPSGAPYLTRMILSCCAADAQPIKVGLAGRIPTDLRPDEWLRIVGTYIDRQVKDDVNGGPIPFLQVSQTTPMPAPADPYEN
jgi:putative membrane protein